MDQVARVLEKRISSLNAATTRNREDAGGEGASQRLLKSGSLDSMMGLRSPGSATPELREELKEDWQIPELAADVILQRDMGGLYPADTSPFADAAQQPLEETVVVTPDRVYHSMTRQDHRNKPHSSVSPRPDPATKWKGNRTLLIFWLASAIAMLISSLSWLHIGMWAGVIGIVGASIPLCGCCSPRRLPLNVHVTRIFAVACSALSIFTALLFAFLLYKLHCPMTVKSAGKCSMFWLGLVMTMLWHSFYALLAAMVTMQASTIVALLEPVGLRRVVVLRPPSRGQSLRALVASENGHDNQSPRTR